jgi:DNA modification methylase
VGYEDHVRIRHHYEGQIGSEATPQEWLAALVACTAEWMRVLKPEGSMFVNLGDKYAGSDGTKGGTGASTLGGGRANGRARDFGAETFDGGGRRAPGLPKCLLGLPWRYALAVMDQLGLILRAEIIWAKPNGLPESVTDRVRRAHEQVFHFTRQPRYYSAVDEIREEHTSDRHPGVLSWAERKARTDSQASYSSQNGHGGSLGMAGNALGKLPGSVWEIASQPLTVPARLGVDHFASFPMALPRRIILGWSPPGVCVACGQGRRPVRQYETDQVGYFGEPIEERRREPSPQQAQQIRQLLIRCREQTGLSRADVSERVVGSRSGACWNWESGLRIPDPAHWRTLKRVLSLPGDWDHLMLDTVMRPSVNGRFLGGIDRHVSAGTAKSQRSPGKTITGYVCACPTPDAPTRPAVVLDPFGGTGTTALVAAMHSRLGISIDRSADYTRLATWRCNDPAERAKALQVPKPPPIPDGMEALF